VEMRKIRVAMLAPYLLDSKHNGLSMHINKLTNHLSQREDTELHVVTFGKENKQLRKGNLTIHIIKTIAKLPEALLIFQIQSLKREIMEIHPDIIHAQGSFALYSTATALMWNKYPTLLTVHGIVAKEFKFYREIHFILSIFIHIPNERYVLSKIPNIIVCSPQMEKIVSNMTNSKIHVIPNGIDIEDSQNIEPHKLSKSHSILFIGGLRKAKGIDILIGAFPLIKKSDTDSHLFIGGIGPEEKKIKKLVKKLNIEEKVEFLGFVSEDEKYAYYKSVDLCVFPSVYEPFGIVCLEAMVCGRPVVASNVGGIPFVVENGKTGLLFESGNVKDLAEKVIILLKNKELRDKMGEVGRERAKEFTWDKIAEQTVEVYKEIIEEWRKGSNCKNFAKAYIILYS
jgi:glycosyltransferase involved in cell wall biosynthesis